MNVLDRLEAIQKSIDVKRAEIENLKSRTELAKEQLKVMEDSAELAMEVARHYDTEARERRELMEEELNTMALNASSGAGVSYADIKTFAANFKLCLEPAIEESEEEDPPEKTAAA